MKHFVALTSVINATVETLKTDLGIPSDGFMVRINRSKSDSFLKQGLGKVSLNTVEEDGNL